MNVSELTENIISTLSGAAEDGEVSELLVIYRDQAGELYSAVATTDLLTLCDHSRHVLNRIESDSEPELITRH